MVGMDGWVDGNILFFFLIEERQSRGQVMFAGMLVNVWAEWISWVTVAPLLKSKVALDQGTRQMLNASCFIKYPYSATPISKILEMGYKKLSNIKSSKVLTKSILPCFSEIFFTSISSNPKIFFRPLKLSFSPIWHLTVYPIFLEMMCVN